MQSIVVLIVCGLVVGALAGDAYGGYRGDFAVGGLAELGMGPYGYSRGAFDNRGFGKGYGAGLGRGFDGYGRGNGRRFGLGFGKNLDLGFGKRYRGPGFAKGYGVGFGGGSVTGLGKRNGLNFRKGFGV